MKTFKINEEKLKACIEIDKEYDLENMSPSKDTTQEENFIFSFK